MDADHVIVAEGRTRAVPFSAQTLRHICYTCASPVFLTRDARLDMRAIYVGALDDPSGFQPEMHVRMSSNMNPVSGQTVIPV